LLYLLLQGSQVASGKCDLPVNVVVPVQHIPGIFQSLIPAFRCVCQQLTSGFRGVSYTGSIMVHAERIVQLLHPLYPQAVQAVVHNFQLCQQAVDLALLAIRRLFRLAGDQSKDNENYHKDVSHTPDSLMTMARQQKMRQRACCNNGAAADPDGVQS
jgi:hypothetical protein